MAFKPKTRSKGKRRPPVSRGKPSRLRKAEFHKPNSSVEAELRTKSAGRDKSSVHGGSMADIIKEVASRRHRRDQPF